MPWKVVTAVEQRKRFVEVYQSDEAPKVAVLCREFGISRNTAYRWIHRFDEFGDDGLVDRSKAAHEHPNMISPQMEELVVLARQAHPSWGAKKLLPWLQRKNPGRDDWPCVASVSAILERNQLVRSRKRRRLVAAYDGKLTGASQPNDVWCIDHKGWWLAGDGAKCEPLTVTDEHTRYLIRCVLGAGKGTAEAMRVLTAAFHEYGLPIVIRSDNGAPFASRAPQGLSMLSVWLMRLGVRPERIQAGKPQQNARHERMHATMVSDGTDPVGASVRQEQKRLNAWREEFNNERPHEALNFATPSSLYSPSPRLMPRCLPELEYGAAMRTRRVDVSGKIVWCGRDLFLTEALRGQWLGFEASQHDGVWVVWFGGMFLGTFDEKRHQMVWVKNLSGRAESANAGL